MKTGKKYADERHENARRKGGWRRRTFISHVAERREKEGGQRDRDGDTPTLGVAISRVTMTGVVAGGSETHAKPPCVWVTTWRMHIYIYTKTIPRNEGNIDVPRSLSSDPLSHLRRFRERAQPVDQTRFRASRLLRETWLLSYLCKKNNI